MAIVALELTVHAAIAAVVDRVGHDAFTNDVARRTEALIDRLGLTSGVEVRVVPDGRRAVVLRANGNLLSYPPSFLTRLWFGIAPPELRGAALGAAASSGLHGAWLADCAEHFLARDERRGYAAVAQLVARLVLEVLALRPSALLAPQDAADLVGVGEGGTRLSPMDAAKVLGGLVDLGVGLRDRDLVLRTVHSTLAAGRSAADVLEEVFVRVRARSLEVQVDPATYAQLTTSSVPEPRLEVDDPRVKLEVREVVTAVYDHRLQELGVRLPLMFVRMDAFALPEIRVRANTRISPSIPIPSSDRVAVAAPPAELEPLGIHALPLVDAFTGHEFSSVSREDLRRLERAGHTAVPPLAYAAAAFARAVTPLAHRMVSLDEVEDDLATLEADLPTLVHAALRQYGIGGITRLLRALVREQVSIRDLRRILNAMMAFADTTPTDRRALFVEDPLPSADGADMPDWLSWVDPQLLAFVRAELGDRVCHDSGLAFHDAPVVAVHETDPAFEELVERLLASDEGDTKDVLVAEIREHVWRGLGKSALREPVLVTSARVRLAVRRAIEAELPAAHVLARAEIPAMARTYVGRRISTGA